MAKNLLETTKSTLTNGGFETGDLSGWTPLTEGFNAGGAVISDETYWGSNPYNQAGNYHLDGWAGMQDESATWGVRSSTFTLGGSGYISVRMAGRSAAVKVYKTDGTLVGHFRQTRYGVDHVTNDWADMATYVMDLTDNIGEQLYIELWDALPGVDWGVAFFDEVVIYYADVPDTSKVDLVFCGKQTGIAAPCSGCSARPQGRRCERSHTATCDLSGYLL